MLLQHDDRHHTRKVMSHGGAANAFSSGLKLAMSCALLPEHVKMGDYQTSCVVKEIERKQLFAVFKMRGSLQLRTLR
ncbi:hypothetical protein MRB53_038211 [Persea americana]|nr:hypothetical protein MRB53_038211 [Persea americana]